jgi:pimeloyl-ACP methyl ester carboxylesterase
MRTGASGHAAPSPKPHKASSRCGTIRTSRCRWRPANFRKLARQRPTLLVRGALSDLIEPEQAAYMRKAAPAMLYAEVPGVGHAPMLTEPEAMSAVREFLAQVD